jgi:hypothetical protein
MELYARVAFLSVDKLEQKNCDAISKMEFQFWFFIGIFQFPENLTNLTNQDGFLNFLTNGIFYFDFRKNLTSLNVFEIRCKIFYRKIKRNKESSRNYFFRKIWTNPDFQINIQRKISLIKKCVNFPTISSINIHHKFSDSHLNPLIYGVSRKLKI